MMASSPKPPRTSQPAPSTQSTPDPKVPKPRKARAASPADDKPSAWARRLKLLHYLIRRGYIQTAEAAAYLGDEKRHALGDLKALEEHGVPVWPHPEDPRSTRRMWKLEDSWRVSGVEVRLSERLALLLGKEILDPLLGASDLGRAMQSLEHELGSVAQAVDDDSVDLLRRFYLVQEPSKDYAHRGEDVTTIVEAIAGNHELSFDYRRPNRDEARPMRVRPLTLAIYRRGLYLFVLNAAEDARKILTLAVDRITNLVPHHEAVFEYPTRGRWDPQKYLARRFGLTTQPDEEPQRVRLRFPRESRMYALERQWMPDQVVLANPDGGVDIVFEAEGAELPHRILEWGGYCEVIEPPALRDKVIELARKVLARHGVT